MVEIEVMPQKGVLINLLPALLNLGARFESSQKTRLWQYFLESFKRGLPMGVLSDSSPRDVVLKFTSEIAAAYVGNNSVPSGELSNVIKSIHATLAALEGSPVGEQQQLKPAVSIKKSVADDYIICLEDGRKMKMLKRYLRSHYDMSPEDYRAKWGLPHDYPMVAPSYAVVRSEFAKKIGLGKVARNSSKGRRRS